jgi:hypothetical protein
MTSGAGTTSPNRPAEQSRRGWTTGRIAALAAFAAIAGLWVYGFSPLAPSGHPDKLDNPAFAEAAAPVCEAAIDKVNALPQAGELIDLDVPEQEKRVLRADQIETATAVLDSMVVRLRTLAPPTGSHDGDVVNGWLADWDVYLSDRLAYAADFRAGVDGPFLVTKKDNKPITTPMDGFSQANELQECLTPLDV